jgi:3-hydroxyisobutyrate dehydrogenase-like beta-hydroxyacid dehydrogenase
MPKIGLVGLGRMGRPICANLVRAGYPCSPSTGGPRPGDRPPDRCCEELRIATELARDHHLPFPVSESVAGLYRQALRRYGPADGELLAVALLEEQAGLWLRHPPAAG